MWNGQRKSFLVRGRLSAFYFIISPFVFLLKYIKTHVVKKFSPVLIVTYFIKTRFIN